MFSIVGNNVNLLGLLSYLQILNFMYSPRLGYSPKKILVHLLLQGTFLSKKLWAVIKAIHWSMDIKAIWIINFVNFVPTGLFASREAYVYTEYAYLNRSFYSWHTVRLAIFYCTKLQLFHFLNKKHLQIPLHFSLVFRIYF